MSARVIIAETPRQADLNMQFVFAEEVLRRLAASGYRILAPGELDYRWSAKTAEAIRSRLARVGMESSADIIRDELDAAIRNLKGNGNG